MSNPMTILLVEDEILIAANEKLQLEREGNKVILANSGEKAIAEMSDPNQAIDLILMDINLGPGMDGTEAAEKILQRHDLPILFLSSHTEKEIVEKTERITNYGYVVKNSSFTVLDASIKMASKLFAAQKKINTINMDLERVNEELNVSLLSLQQANATLASNEKQLSRSEERFESLFNRAPLGYQSLDADGRFIEVNQAWLDLLGFNREEVIGRWFGDFLAPEFVEAFRERFPQFKAAGRIHSEFQMIRKGGERCFVGFDGRVGYSRDGAFQQTHCILQDLSERRKAESLFAESEARYRAIFENTTDAIFIYDPRSFNILDANEATYALYGYERNELLGISCLLFSAEVFDSRKAAARILAEGTVAVPLRHHRRKDGTDIYVSLTGHSVTIGGSQVAFSVCRDISEEKKAKEALAASVNEFQLLAEAMPQIVWICGPDGKTIYFNQKWMAYTGMTLEDSLGDGWNKPFHSDDQSRSWEAWQHAVFNGGDYSLECRIRRDDGDYRWWLVRGSPVLGEDGKIIKWFGTCTDIHDLKVSERNLSESETRLRLVIENSKDVIFSIDREYRLLIFNERYREGTRNALGRGPIVGERVLSPEYPAELNQLWKSRYDKGLKGEEVEFNSEATWLDGRKVHYITTITPMRSGDAEVVGLICVTRDITKGLESERTINSLLQAKEVLLKETHHRFKNNMNSVISILLFQAELEDDEKVRRILEEVAGRIKVMGDLYTNTYQRSGVEESHLRDYISETVTQIIGSYPARAKIDVVLEVGEFDLKESIMTPLGMMLYELVSNTMKYAFIGRTTGMISISIKGTGDRVFFEYADDGVGLPESVSPGNSRGFGMNLVASLTEQLKATIEIKREAGTRFIIAF